MVAGQHHQVSARIDDHLRRIGPGIGHAASAGGVALPDQRAAGDVMEADIDRRADVSIIAGNGDPIGTNEGDSGDRGGGVLLQPGELPVVLETHQRDMGKAIMHGIDHGKSGTIGRDAHAPWRGAVERRGMLPWRRPHGLPVGQGRRREQDSAGADKSVPTRCVDRSHRAFRRNHIGFKRLRAGQSDIGPAGKKVPARSPPAWRPPGRIPGPVPCLLHPGWRPNVQPNNPFAFGCCDGTVRAPDRQRRVSFSGLPWRSPPGWPACPFTWNRNA